MTQNGVRWVKGKLVSGETPVQAEFNIVAGPSKFDLMLALFDGTIEHHRCVEFEFNTTPRMTVKTKFLVSSVQREDGSGESWNFEGSLSYDNFCTLKNVRGYYSTKTRTGTFRFV
jgi:hypothetical protein